jgi:hypothetical protein
MIVASTAAAQVIAWGLNHPRGIAFGPEVALYVAEAGTGGSLPCVFGPEGQQFYGRTGSITRINLRRGTQERVATERPSIAGPDGFGALGPRDISFNGRGEARIPTGLGADPGTREPLCGEAGMTLARMVKMPASGGIQWLEDLGACASANNPPGEEEGSNHTAFWRCLASGSWPTRVQTHCPRSKPMARSRRLGSFQTASRRFRLRRSA